MKIVAIEVLPFEAGGTIGTTAYRRPHAAVKVVTDAGLTGISRIAAVAQAYHVRVAPHGASFPEITAHLVASLPNGLIVSAFPPGEPYEVWSRLYREPLRLQEGQIRLTGAPGLGLELDEGFIARHRP